MSICKNNLIFGEKFFNLSALRPVKQINIKQNKIKKFIFVKNNDRKINKYNPPVVGILFFTNNLCFESSIRSK